MGLTMNVYTMVQLFTYYVTIYSTWDYKRHPGVTGFTIESLSILNTVRLYYNDSINLIQFYNIAFCSSLILFSCRNTWFKNKRFVRFSQEWIYFPLFFETNKWICEKFPFVGAFLANISYCKYLYQSVLQETLIFPSHILSV